MMFIGKGGRAPMTTISDEELLLRLVLSCVLGGIIGYER